MQYAPREAAGGRLRVQRRGVEDLEAITRTGSGEGRVGKLTDV